MAGERHKRNIVLRKGSKKPATPADRVDWYRNHVWNGNHSAMARDCACSPSVLSMIATGNRQPGTDLLQRIAQHPKVNPAWLFSGEGEPLVAEKQEATADGWPLKISTTPLPGPLEDHVGLLTAKSLAVSGAIYSPSRYVYQVAPNEPLVQDRDVAVLAGDLLIIESDPTVWQRNVLSLDDKICAIRIGEEGSAPVVLAIVDAHLSKQKQRVEMSVRQPTSKDRRRAGSHKGHKLQLDDVVGMAIVLVREL